MVWVQQKAPTGVGEGESRGVVFQGTLLRLQGVDAMGPLYPQIAIAVIARLVLSC